MTEQVYNGIDGNSIVKPTGYYGTIWPQKVGSGVIPEGISAGGWTLDTDTKERGYPQQTFLGASIRSFNMNGGFGDSSSTLSIDLVNDEFNKSDEQPLGYGDDVYHNGIRDTFVPPIAGTPVFFKFGPTLATVEQAYRKIFDQLYGTVTTTSFNAPVVGTYDKDNLSNLTLTDKQFVDLTNNNIYDYKNEPVGQKHITFGGILQSYIQNRGFGGNPLYSVQVVDPREILSNVVVLLNNYAGTTFNTKNIFNVYGFLEYNVSQGTISALNNFGMNKKNILTRTSFPDGSIVYGGSVIANDYLDSWVGMGLPGYFGLQYVSFPITGTGFSRRSSQGIPYYRVKQGLNALMSSQYQLPEEYQLRGFGGVINFRGYNYVVDFGGLPDLPMMYFLDFDQINLLDLALEICEVTSRELFVSLLPVINHPACKFIYNYNQANGSDPTKLIAGIIRLDSIDRSVTPAYGSIKNYIDGLESQKIFVENQDVGYELSNVTTDKFVVGAQEVDMYYFSTNADRDVINARSRRSNGDYNDASWFQWLLEKQLEQQVLPYYGTLGKNAITIPKGWGAYQQILLDTTTLNAKGVGSYYVATEMELRAASISYDCWKSFLQQYNDVYLESIEDDDTIEGAALNQTPQLPGVNIPEPPNISNNYAVTVPRSVFDTYAATPFGSDGLPSSPCNPPYGYPLYYKRMSKIGIPEGGLTKLQSRVTSMIGGIATLRGVDADSYEEVKNLQLSELEYIAQEYGTLTQTEKDYYNAVNKALESTPPNISLLNEVEESLHKIQATLPRLAKKGTENALKVYNFLKKNADENLGKKFLVKIPNKVNLFYNKNTQWKNNNPNLGEYVSGPFGFRPRSPVATIGYEVSESFFNSYYSQRPTNQNMMKSFLSTTYSYSPYNGALKANYNPITTKYEFNYTPTNLGGYFPFELYSNTLSLSQIQSLSLASAPIGVIQGLVPQDLTNFLDENGRMSPYVRFDNSQDLAFGSMNAEDFTQQLMTPAGMIPDLCEFLDNLGEDKFDSFANADVDRKDNFIKPKQCSFVKCSVDENFYMPPKTIFRNIDVYGDTNYNLKLSRPRKFFIPCSGISNGQPVPDPKGTYVDSYRYLEKHYYPTTNKLRSTQRWDFNTEANLILGSYLVKTDLEDLDTNNVYALITLPHSVIPTKDSRYRDAINQKDNTASVKHYLTMDVVKGLPEFATPAYAKSPSATNILVNDPGCDIYQAQARSVAWLAAKKAKQDLQFGFPQQVQAFAPSPVYPDLVAIPLISNERCYGPWVSSQVDPQSNALTNIGGRVEFIKDENLAPWNYAGYDLMNSAGVFQARFTNNLLLFSERGGFTFPGLPDISLCSALVAGGPLVTNITVDVSTGGIKTTYKMDLYTSSFGKLQKQKQDMISKISRERQRLRDERNALIRKGIGKNQTTSNTNIAGAVNMLASEGTPLSQSLRSNPLDHIVLSVLNYETKSYAPSLATFSSDVFGSNPYPGMVSQTDYVTGGCFLPESTINDINNAFDDDNQRQAALLKTGGMPISQFFAPFSNEVGNPYLASKRPIDRKASNRLYEVEGEEGKDGFIINDSQVTQP